MDISSEEGYLKLKQDLDKCMTKSLALRKGIKEEQSDDSVNIEDKDFSMLLDPKVEPLDNADSAKIFDNSEGKEKYNHLVESSCNFFSSNNLNSNEKQIQRFSAEILHENFECSIDNVSDLDKNSKIYILQHSLKEEIEDVEKDIFNNLSDNDINSKRGNIEFGNSKVKPLENVDIKIPINFDNEEKYSNLVENNCTFVSSDNLNGTVKEIQRCYKENLIEGLESGIDNVGELFKDYKLEISEHSLKMKTRDFNTSKENIKSVVVMHQNGIKKNKVKEIKKPKLGKVDNSVNVLSSNGISNEIGVLNLNPEGTKVREKITAHKDLGTSILRHKKLLPIVCQICKLKFGSKYNLDYHIVSKHLNNEKAMDTVTSKIHSCTACTYKTMNGTYFKIHLQKHEDIRADKKLQCYKCDYKTIYKSALKLHIQRHAGPARYPCQVCSKKFRSDHELDSHIFLTHSKIEKTKTGNVYSCKMCAYKSTNGINFKTHLKAHKLTIKEANNFQCHKCNFKTIYRGNLIKHFQRKHNDSETFPCQLCIKKYPSRTSLANHIVSVHPESEKAMNSITNKIRSCEICGYKTVYINSYKYHMSKHTEQKSFSCRVCDKKFRTKKQMETHIVALHSSNEKAMITVTCTVYSCEICPYKSTDRKRFLIHLERHGGVQEKVYSCKYRTDKSTDIKLHKKNHKSLEQDDKIYQCYICTYKTEWKNSLSSHIRLHTNKSSYPCKTCNQCFSKKRFLDAHIVATHSDIEEMTNSVTYTIYSCYTCSFKTVDSYNFINHKLTHKEGKQYQCDFYDHTLKPKRNLLCQVCNIKFSTVQQLDGHILTLHLENEEIMNSVTSEVYQCDKCNFKTVWFDNIRQHVRMHGNT